MRKLLLVTVCLLSFAYLKAQTFTSGHITFTATDTAYHDSVNCMTSCNFRYLITVDSSYAGQTLNIVDTTTGVLVGASPYINTTGASPWSFSTIYLGGTGVWDVQIVSGDYHHFSSPVLKITAGTDTVYGFTKDSILVTNPCLYSSVTGAVYIDNNGNCLYDTGDVFIAPPPVSVLESLSSPPGYGWPYGFGPGWGGSGGWCHYTMTLQQSWMVNYTVSIPSYYSFIFPNAPCFAGYAPFTTLPQINIDFPLECSSHCDVQCSTLTPASVRLHRDLYIQPYVSNTGCDTESGTFTVILDSRVIYDAALTTYPPDTVRGDTLIWNYTGLTSLGSAGTGYWNSFLSNIHLSLDTTIAVGDTLCFSGYANIPAADVDPLNNAFSFCIPVVYSHDPNEKVVSPQGTGPEGYIPGGHDTLTYTLNFQNTGTASAYDVNIIDTLDSHINAGSLKILGTSANMEPQWLAPGVVKFSFNNIYLPDSSTDFAASQGAVRFSVALNPGLVPGTQIKNTGYIYFDANPAVVTNTVLNTIDSTIAPNSVHPLAVNTGITIYPNPATTQITISAPDNITSIVITNLMGQRVYSQQCHATQVLVDVTSMPNGIYLVRLNGGEVRKFVKE